jgi:hypothetical protein
LVIPETTSCATSSRPKRVPIEDASPGENGKVPTKVQRVDEGNIPLAYHAGFPHGVRGFLGRADPYYLAGRLPCGITIEG